MEVTKLQSNVSMKHVIESNWMLCLDGVWSFLAFVWYDPKGLIKRYRVSRF